jgi:hypothetical protein
MFATLHYCFVPQMNEIAWNKAGDLFFITTGLGRILNAFSKLTLIILNK